MNTTDIDYLDGEFTVQESEPSTLAEVVTIVGTEAAVIEDAVSNLRYRNKYPRVYKKVSAEVAAKHAFPRAVVSTKTLKDGAVRNIHESENDHLRAFLKGREEEVTGEDGKTETKIVTPAPEGNREILTGLFTSIANSEPLYVEGDRKGGGGKVSAASLETANKFFAAGADKVEAVAKKIEEMVPGYSVGRDSDGAITPDSLARGIQALDKKLVNDAKQQRMASLA